MGSIIRTYADEILEVHRQTGLAIADGHTDRGVPVTIIYGESLKDFTARIAETGSQGVIARSIPIDVKVKIDSWGLQVKIDPWGLQRDIMREAISRGAAPPIEGPALEPSGSSAEPPVEAQA